MAHMRQAMSALQATGAGVGRAHHLAMLAEILSEAGQVEEGLVLLDEALTSVDDSGEGIFEAELHRLKEELLLLRGATEGQAEACFHQGIAVARRQQAKSLELRAATSLSRLLLRQGKSEEAHHILTEIYDWFSEGFGTPDLIEARALLEALS
jgi:predicted ATPase